MKLLWLIIGITPIVIIIAWMCWKYYWVYKTQFWMKYIGPNDGHCTSYVIHFPTMKMRLQSGSVPWKFDSGGSFDRHATLSGSPRCKLDAGVFYDVRRNLNGTWEYMMTPDSWLTIYKQKEHSVNGPLLSDETLLKVRELQTENLKLVAIAKTKGMSLEHYLRCIGTTEDKIHRAVCILKIQVEPDKNDICSLIWWKEHSTRWHAMSEQANIFDASLEVAYQKYINTQNIPIAKLDWANIEFTQRKRLDAEIQSDNEEHEKNVQTFFENYE